MHCDTLPGDIAAATPDASSILMPSPRILIDLGWMIPGRSGGLEEVAYCFLGQLFARPDLASVEGLVILIVPSQIIDAFRAVVPRGVLLRTRDDLLSDTWRLISALTRHRLGGRREDYDASYSL